MAESAVRARARALVQNHRPQSPTLAPLRATGVANLPPSVGRWEPPMTDIARSLRDHGGFVVTGVVAGFDDAEGSGTTSIKLSLPKLSEGVGGGGGSITVPIDLEAARYLPPRTRVRLTLEIVPYGTDD